MTSVRNSRELLPWYFQLPWLLAFVPAAARADIASDWRPLTDVETAGLGKQAKERFGDLVAEIRGGSDEYSPGRRYDATVYLKPERSHSGICRSDAWIYSTKTRSPSHVAWPDEPTRSHEMAWLARDGKCRGLPSAGVIVDSPVDDVTLHELLADHVKLAKAAVALMQRNPGFEFAAATKQPTRLTGLGIVASEDGDHRFQLISSGESGAAIQYEVERRGASLVVVSAGLAPVP